MLLYQFNLTIPPKEIERLLQQLAQTGSVQIIILLCRAKRTSQMDVDAQIFRYL